MMQRRPAFFRPAALATGLIALLLATSVARAADRTIDFARDVLPILSDNCFHCHGPDETGRKAKLRLDTKDGAYRVKDGVAVIAPGKPDDSELIHRVFSNDADDVMPPRDGVRQLTDAQKQTLKEWVRQGAPWGVHWAFTPVNRPTPPVVKQADWVKNDIDRFILARLEKEGLTPAPPADKARLLRRVTFDLTGLPPTPEELDAFIADSSEAAYEKALERLLASPRYGERMASEWLDIARFADTHGYQMDRFRPMHPYRDWVIKAFNENLPFDQFGTWQLAGDLLPNATKEQRLATAFNRLHMQNEEGGIVEEEFRVAYVVDRVNTMGTAFMAMTFECSRCHDHKYDPISQKDFYSLFAFFQNIDESGQTTYFTSAMPVPTMALTTDEQDAKIATLEKAVAERQAALDRAKADAAGAAFGQWLKSRPAQLPGDLPGLSARYSFDSLDKNQAANAVDPKNPARVSDHAIPVDGRIDNAAGLDGENGLTFPNVGNFTRVDPFTFALWIKADEINPRAVVLHKSKAPIDAGSRGYELLLEDGRVAFGMHWMWPGNSVKVRSTKPVAKGQWTHVAVTYDGSSKAAGVRIYIDGQPAPQEAIKDTLWKDITYGGGEPTLTIGSRFRDNGFRGGAVDELHIYTRQLSDAEVAHVAGKTTLADAWRDPAGQADVLKAYYLATAAEPAVAEAADALRVARKALNDVVTSLPEAMVMKELPTPKPAYVLKRGNYDQPGDAVSADTPHVLPPFPADAPRNRLGLARWLFDPQNPLTARVTVNRLWQQMFGVGLVETSDNFGSTGIVPTHPELLDYLARVFVDDFKWDQKKFLKFLALSASYRQGSKGSAEALAKDPINQLLSRGRARRLTAEMLRDQSLAASGLLVEKLGGPSVKPYQPAGIWEIAMGRPKYDQGKGDDLYRRSLYTYVKRTVAPPSLLTFDAGDRSVCTVKRQSTSTPLQSLALLNDVQGAEAARKLAERAMKAATDDAGRLAYSFRVATSRVPSDRELKVLTALLSEQRALFAADPEAAKKLLTVGASKPDATLNATDLAAYAVTCQAILNHDEAVMRR
jgi:hypothetical protein